jgi:beta-N-acetylhexosaminidase
MSERELGQMLLMGLPGPELDSGTAGRLRRLQPGGILLFSRNIRSPRQLRTLVDDVRGLLDREPIVTIDQEGGRVSRLRALGSEPPSAWQLKERGDTSLIREHGKLTARLLRLFGFNLNLCPVLDIGFDNEADNSLKGRCYGSDVQEVISNAGVFNRALRGGGVLSCGKHFPGCYARAACDAHETLPVIGYTVEELEREEIAPFRALLPELDSIMVGHSHFPAFDATRPRWPASLSRAIISDLLRDQLGFGDGLVMTDDLDMGAILEEVSFGDAIRHAVTAGNDMVMICHRLEMVERAKEHLLEIPDLIVVDALERIERTKRRLEPPTAFSEEAFQAIDKEVWDLRLATLGEERARERSPEDGKRSPVELY